MKKEKIISVDETEHVVGGFYVHVDEINRLCKDLSEVFQDVYQNGNKKGTSKRAIQIMVASSDAAFLALQQVVNGTVEKLQGLQEDV